MALNVAAGDAATPVVELERLYKENRAKSIRQALAANPSTPITLLAELLESCPEAVCRNPVAPLLALESPELAASLSFPACRQLLRCEDAPASLVALLTTRIDSDADIAAEARLHIQIAGEIGKEEAGLEIIRDYWRDYARRRSPWAAHDCLLASELNILPPGLLDDLLPELTARDPFPHLYYETFLERSGGSYRDRIERAANPSASLAEMEDAFKDDVWVRAALASNPNLPPHLRSKLLISAEVVRIAITRTPTTTWDELQHLSRESTSAVKRAILRNPLAQDTHYRVNLTSEFLRQYLPSSNDHTITLMRFLALQTIPLHEQPIKSAKLARSQYWQDRLALVLALPPQSGKPPQFLKTLAQDGNRLVRAAARARLRGEEVVGERDFRALSPAA